MLIDIVNLFRDILTTYPEMPAAVASIKALVTVMESSTGTFITSCFLYCMNE